MRITHGKPRAGSRPGASGWTRPGFLLVVAGWLMLLIVGLVGLAGQSGISVGRVAVGVLFAVSAALALGINRWLSRDCDDYRH